MGIEVLDDMLHPLHGYVTSGEHPAAHLGVTSRRGHNAVEADIDDLRPDSRQDRPVARNTWWPFARAWATAARADAGTTPRSLTRVPSASRNTAFARTVES